MSALCSNKYLNVSPAFWQNQNTFWNSLALTTISVTHTHTHAQSDMHLIVFHSYLSKPLSLSLILSLHSPSSSHICLLHRQLLSAIFQNNFCQLCSMCHKLHKTEMLAEQQPATKATTSTTRKTPATTRTTTAARTWSVRVFRVDIKQLLHQPL